MTTKRLKDLPPTFSSPFWRDRFFWIFAGTCAFWLLVGWLVFLR
jgi:hypothetical protein